VLNVIPPHGASAIARSAGVVTANDRWCDVDFLTFESVKVKNVHVLGRRDPDRDRDAEIRPHGESAREGLRRGSRRAARGKPPNPAPVLNNTCYSFITDKDVVHRLLGPPVRQGEEDGVAGAGRRAGSRRR
jgi:hypothetical protein